MNVHQLHVTLFTVCVVTVVVMVLWREYFPWTPEVAMMRDIAKCYDLVIPRWHWERYGAWAKRVDAAVEEVRAASDAYVEAASRDGEFVWINKPWSGYWTLPTGHPAALRYARARGLLPKSVVN